MRSANASARRSSSEMESSPDTGCWISSLFEKVELVSSFSEIRYLEVFVGATGSIEPSTAGKIKGVKEARSLALCGSALVISPVQHRASQKKSTYSPVLVTYLAETLRSPRFSQKFCPVHHSNSLVHVSIRLRFREKHWPGKTGSCES